jgi:enoyl-CoA hydratase
MPECTIGLAPDVGGSFILARANGAVPGLRCLDRRHRPAPRPRRRDPRRLRRRFAPEETWPASRPGSSPPARRPTACRRRPTRRPRSLGGHVGPFRQAAPAAILAALAADDSDAARTALAAIRHNAPLATAAHLELLRRLGPAPTLREALRAEYRYTWRSIAQGDFLEGIRALIIDKDRTPRWTHDRIEDVTEDEIAAMLAPLGDEELTFDGEETP